MEIQNAFGDLIPQQDIKTTDEGLSVTPFSDLVPKKQTISETFSVDTAANAVDTYVKTPAALAYGMASWPFAQAARFGAMYGQKGQQALGLVPKLSDEEITKLGEETAEWFSSLGGTLTPKTGQGIKAVELAGKIVQPITAVAHWVNSGIDKEKYPHAAQLAETTTEGMFFGFLHKFGTDAVKVGKKQLKARATKKAKDIEVAKEAEAELMKKVDEAAKKQEFDEYLEQFRNAVIEKAKAKRETVEPVERTTGSILREGKEIAEARIAENLSREQIPQKHSLRQQANIEKGIENLTPKKVTKSDASKRTGIKEGEVHRPDLGAEPVSAFADLIPKTKPEKITEVQHLSDQGIPRKEYQIDPKTGKPELTKEIGEKTVYKIGKEGVALVEEIPGERSVWQIIQKPLKNEKGSIDLTALNEAGKKLYTAGDKYFDWQKKLQKEVGEEWEKVKPHVAKLWADAKKDRQDPKNVVKEFNEQYPGHNVKFDSVQKMPEIMKHKPDLVYFTPQKGSSIEGATMALDVKGFSVEKLKKAVDQKVKEFEPEKSKIDVKAGKGGVTLNSGVDPIELIKTILGKNKTYTPKGNLNFTTKKVISKALKLEEQSKTKKLIKFLLDPLMNERGTVDVTILKEVFGQAPKGDSLYSKLTKNGVVKDDLKLSGIASYLKEKGRERVNWEEIKQIIDEGGFEVKKETYGKAQGLTVKEKIELQRIESDYTYGQPTENQIVRYGELVNKQDTPTATKYGPKETPEYNLPGHKEGTYKETLYKYDPAAKKGRDIDAAYERGEIGFQEATDKHFNRVKESFDEAHWGKEGTNVMAHERGHDRIVAGKDVRYVDEVQSKWHDRGKRDGYGESEFTVHEERVSALNKLNPDEAAEVWNSVSKEHPNWNDSKVGKEVDKRVAKMKVTQYYIKDAKGKRHNKTFLERFDAESEANNLRYEIGVPNAPFKKTWHQMVMRDVISDAVTRGKEGIAWSTGKIQQERWKGAKTDYSSLYDNKIKKFMEKEAGVKAELVETEIPSTKIYEQKVKEWKVRLQQYKNLIKDFPETAKKQNAIEKVAELERKIKSNSGQVWHIPITSRLKKLYSSSKVKSAFDILLEPIKNQDGSVTLPTKEVKDFVRKAGKLSDEYLGSINTRLGNIDQSIKNKMRAFELDSNTRTENNIRKVLPYIEKVKKMSKEDYKKFDFARKNSDHKTINYLLKKYGIEKEHSAMRKILDQMYDNAAAAGYKIRYRPEHYPREVIDYSGLLDHLYQSKSWSSVERLIRSKEKKLKRVMTDQEKVKLINQMYRGYADQQITLSQPGQLKLRKVYKLTPEMEKFYADSDSALLRYISDVSTAIEAKKLFGGKGKSTGIDYNETIGAYLLKLYKEKKINPSQEIIIRDILKARFDPKGTSGIVTTLKNIALVDVMGQYKSAVTQLGDIGFSLYKNGIKETVNALIPAIKGKSKFTKEDLGISKIAAEFTDKSDSAKLVDGIFEASQLTRVDAWGKEALINAAYSKATKLTQKAQSHKGKIQFEKELEGIFGKEAKEVLDDFANKRSTRNVKLYLLHVLADFQPAILSELPAGFLKGGNWRVLYMLKSFGVKRLDVYRREIFQNIAKPETRMQGIRNLVRLAVYLSAAEASADVIKDLMSGKKVDISDTVLGNLGDLVISRYVASNIGKEGIGTGLKKQILPPTQLLDSVWKDVKTAGDGKGLESVKSIPLIGKPYYDWFGKGAKKKKEKTTGRKSVRKSSRNAIRKATR